jgi:1,4-alpha-glucan branching enzyme
MIATPAPFLTDYDLYLLGEGNHYRIYEKLGAHVSERDGTAGTHFAVWAPNATQVSVIGDFNGWQRNQNLLQSRGSSGVWQGFIPKVGPGASYKYAIVSPHRNWRGFGTPGKRSCRAR